MNDDFPLPNEPEDEDLPDWACASVTRERLAAVLAEKRPKIK